MVSTIGKSEWIGQGGEACGDVLWTLAYETPVAPSPSCMLHLFSLTPINGWVYDCASRLVDRM